MFLYILRRLLQMIPLVLGITILSFGAMQLAPGDYVEQMKQNPQIRPETIKRLRQQYGLDKPPAVQYFYWLKNAAQGNFGESFTYKEPAFKLIMSRAYYTILLAFYSGLLAWVLAIPLGIYAATHRNNWLDRVLNFGAFAGISLPGFFVALLAMRFALISGWFPVGGASSVNYEQMSQGQKILDTAHHLILPTLVLGIGGIAGLMRQMRGNLLDVLSENYILAARARGLSERAVIVKHATRNAINPLITLVGYQISGLLAGAALVENVMAWPGLGRLLLESVQTQDLYVSMASFVMGAVLLIVGNLIADILLAITDPRIKFS